MSKIDYTKEGERVKKERKSYLLAARQYAALLAEASKLDPSILSITDDMARTGELVSIYDSKIITDFYSRLLAHSKIDSSYHNIVRDIKKAKSNLENIAYRLFDGQVALALKKAGLPSIKHNLEIAEIADHINDRKLSLLSKIAYGTGYIKEEILVIEGMISAGEITIVDGNIVGQTKAAKAYLRDLEKTLVSRVNDHYFGPKSFDIKRIYISSKNTETNILGLLSSIGDGDHLRELERRIAAGDIVLAKGEILPQTEKGRRYIRLVTEELNLLLDSKMNQHILGANTEVLASDPLLNNVFEIVTNFENKLARHKKVTDKLGFENGYADVVSNYHGDLLKLVQSKKDILTDIDKLSVAALDIRKKLILLANHSEIKVEDSLPVLTALKLLANYEQALDEKIETLASRVKYRAPITSTHIPTITDIRERSSRSSAEGLKAEAQAEISRILKGRQNAEDDLATTVSYIVSSSDYMKEYAEVCAELSALRGYLVEYLDTENRLYRGNELIQTILTEIVEKEIERRELLSEITHEVQLAHKKLWLTKVRNGNDGYLASNVGEDQALLQRAKKMNLKMLKQIEEQITETVNNYRDSHEVHAKRFLQILRQLSTRVNSGEDISVVASELRREYRALEQEHQAELDVLEREMRKLDRQLTQLPEKSRKVIEKSLIMDIKERVNL